MNKFRADSNDLDRLANTLRSSLDDLGRMAEEESPELDAGMSTEIVAQTMAAFYETISKMSADTEQAAAEVGNSGGVYNNADDQAESGLPPLPLPSNEQTGGR